MKSAIHQGGRPHPVVIMADIFPPARQREAMLQLASILDSRHDALRRDDCGDWRISGRRESKDDRRTGRIYADGPTEFVLLLDNMPSKQAFTWAKKAMQFAELEVEGDDNARFRLDRLPSPEEAEVIRHTFAIKKHIHISPEHLAKLQEGLSAAGGFAKFLPHRRKSG